MRVTHVVIGSIVGAVMLFAVLPVAFWLVSWGLDSLFRLPPLPINRPVTLIVTGLSWSIGLFWMLWGYSTLIYVGGGSPLEAFGVAIEPTKQLVSAGPYAYVRNPMVFGFLFVLLGVAFLVGSISGLVLVPVAGVAAAVYLRVFEEKGLVRRFGIAYEHYREHVPLLIPRATPYVPIEGEE